jgi:hypothetical protein
MCDRRSSVIVTIAIVTYLSCPLYFIKWSYHGYRTVKCYTRYCRLVIIAYSRTSTLKMEAIVSSETLIAICKTT